MHGGRLSSDERLPAVGRGVLLCRPVLFSRVRRPDRRRRPPVRRGAGVRGRRSALRPEHRLLQQRLHGRIVLDAGLRSAADGASAPAPRPHVQARRRGVHAQPRLLRHRVRCDALRAARGVPRGGRDLRHRLRLLRGPLRRRCRERRPVPARRYVRGDGRHLWHDRRLLRRRGVRRGSQRRQTLHERHRTLRAQGGVGAPSGQRHLGEREPFRPHGELIPHHP